VSERESGGTTSLETLFVKFVGVLDLHCFELGERSDLLSEHVLISKQLGWQLLWIASITREEHDGLSHHGIQLEALKGRLLGRELCAAVKHAEVYMSIFARNRLEHRVDRRTVAAEHKPWFLPKKYLVVV
jgi:hypothetical protein